MSFSIITVALDAADTLPATLESILAQDFEAVQTILVDGTSTDATPEIIARYKDAVDVVAEVFDAGIFYAMNAALAHATGDYVLFMNAGDRFLAEDTLSAVWARRIGDPDIIYGDHLYAAGGRTTLTRAGDMAELAATLKEGRLSPAWQSAIPAHQATFTRTRLLQAKGYDTLFEICADHAFLFDAFASGASFHYVDEPVAIYAGGGLSARRNLRCRLEFAALYRRFSDHPARVDRYFFPEETPPAFPLTTPAMGAVIAGLLDAPGTVRPTDRDKAGPQSAAPDGASRNGSGQDGSSQDGSWCAGAGFTLLTPRGSRAKALTLAGEIPFGEQTITLRTAGEEIASRRLPRGAFAVTLPLSALLPPGTAVQVETRHGAVLDEAGGRYASLRLERAAFEPFTALPAPPLPFGETVFSSTRQPDSAALLAFGWADLEATHVWSLVKSAEIAFTASGPAREIVVVAHPNPVLPGGQTLTLALNGEPLATAPLSGRTDLRAKAGPHWNAAGENRLTLTVSALAEPPSDPRSLGLALERMIVTPASAAPAPAAPATGAAASPMEEAR
ncbi:putative glycosyltransferase [Stappia sp. 22II-S9-Z10]|nr:putative glycosyltransferase [Stappia sp. 22II-S9-Z10]